MELRREGLSFRQIASRLGVGEGTVRRVFQALADATGTRQKPFAMRIMEALGLLSPAVLRSHQAGPSVCSFGPGSGS